MDIAIISDIHGNYVALEATLEDIFERGIEYVVCLGDVAATGPQPRECVQRMGDLQIAFLSMPVVMGNTDAWLLDPQPFVPNSSKNHDDEFMRKVHEADLWCVEQLTEADRALMRSFKPTISLELDESLRALFYHGSPRSYDETIVATTPDEQLDPMFADHYADHDAQILCGGHTHQPFVRRYHQALLMNPGSVGLPFERIRNAEAVRNPPWAEYALLRCEGGWFDVVLRRVSIDVDAVVRAIHKSGMPHAETWSADWG